MSETSSLSEPSQRYVSQAEDLAREVWCDGQRPEPSLTVSEWADENRYLSQKAASEPGRWRTERTPYLGAVIVGVLQSSAVETPSYFRNGAPKQICLSHGSDWRLDPSLDEGSYPVNSYGGSEPRKLYLRENFAILQMQKAGTRSGHDIVETDILGSGRQSIDTNSVRVTRWAIWASEAERNRPGASPIVQFGAAKG